MPERSLGAFAHLSPLAHVGPAARPHAHAAHNPHVESRSTEKTDDGFLTKLVFANGASVSVDRSRIDGGIETVITRTDAAGVDHVTTRSIVRGPDGAVTIETHGANGGERTVTLTRQDGALTGHVQTVQADGDEGVLDFTLTRGDGKRTLEISGTTPDGVHLDSLVEMDWAARTVTVTDFEGDKASFSLRAFHDYVEEFGLIGVIADVDPGVIG
jgi:hypothetical protein